MYLEGRFRKVVLFPEVIIFLEDDGHAFGRYSRSKKIVIFLGKRPYLENSHHSQTVFLFLFLERLSVSGS
jgi:hypothetical protein